MGDDDDPRSRLGDADSRNRPVPREGRTSGSIRDRKSDDPRTQDAGRTWRRSSRICSGWLLEADRVGKARSQKEAGPGSLPIATRSPTWPIAIPNWRRAERSTCSWTTRSRSPAPASWARRSGRISSCLRFLGTRHRIGAALDERLGGQQLTPILLSPLSPLHGHARDPIRLFEFLVGTRQSRSISARVIYRADGMRRLVLILPRSASADGSDDKSASLKTPLQINRRAIESMPRNVSAKARGRCVLCLFVRCRAPLARRRSWRRVG